MKAFSLRTLFEVVLLGALAAAIVREGNDDRIERPKFFPGETVKFMGRSYSIKRATYFDYGGLANETWLYDVKGPYGNADYTWLGEREIIENEHAHKRIERAMRQ